MPTKQPPEPSTARSEKEQCYAVLMEKCIARSPFPNLDKLRNFSLYAPRQDVTNFLVRYEIFKRVLEIQGSIIECGVLRGGGLMAWAQFSAILEPTNHQRRIVGFDTFSGFPKISKHDQSSESTHARQSGLAVDSYDHLQQCIQLFDMNRFIGHIPKVDLVRGDANKTIPQYLRLNPQLVISLLYLDFDIYEPTLAALKHFLPRMPKGAVVAFDELNSKDWHGESKAVLETLNLHEYRIERCSFGSAVSFAQIG
ncbi:MAG: TylF/MycF/NovP-related O-methyltransferase [Candidatus Sulfotelmatobacter sp.]